MNPSPRLHLLSVLKPRFTRLYGAEADRCAARFVQLLGRYGVGLPEPAPPYHWTQRDAVLIAYGDTLRGPGEPPLPTLYRFLGNQAGDLFNTVHLLPFFPSSSDDGFSVIHFRTVDPALGGWRDIQEFGRTSRLMVDLVLNHVSRESGWFRDFETGVAPARNYFITADPKQDLSRVVRPRTHPLLTPVHTRQGERHVWTTFSADQVDLNFANPDVLFELLDILLFYISQGARVIRLDAVAYLWKTPGTPCIHRPETHEVVKLLRQLLDIVAPDVLLLTETNVPHEENISYFGAGDEAHLVYQFSLPPLVLHALVTGTARHLTAWAAGLASPPAGCTFLNFTASHDGIGVLPLQGLVPDADVDRLVEFVLSRGGRVSSRRLDDGSERPYELNISWFDAMGRPAEVDAELQVRRFLCSQAIPLALQGIPAVYFPSLFATPNDASAVERTGQARSINRRKWEEGDLQSLLSDAHSVPARVFMEYKRLLQVRAQHPAFHPDGRQRVLDLGEAIFAVERTAPDGKEIVLSVSNCTSSEVNVPASGLASVVAGGPARDLVGESGAKPGTPLRLRPYQTVWLSA